jgi:hypothetical protein
LTTVSNINAVTHETTNFLVKPRLKRAWEPSSATLLKNKANWPRVLAWRHLDHEEIVAALASPNGPSKYFAKSISTKLTKNVNLQVLEQVEINLPGNLK